MTQFAASIEDRASVDDTAATTLDLHDLQSGLLHPRPSPYVGTYIVLRVDDARDGRAFIGRLTASIASAAGWSAQAKSWLTVAISYQGFKALGVPDASLASFPPEFKEGMAARAEFLGDTGDSAPEHWEAPLGTADVHIALAAIAPDAARLDTLLEQIRTSRGDLGGVV